MRLLIRAELDKLRTLRSTWVVLGISILLDLAIAAIVLATTSHLRDAPAQICSAAFGLSGVTVAILCASAFAAEYQDRSIATAFTFVPSRWKIVVSKAGAAAIVGALFAILTTAACFVLAAVWLHSSSVAWPWSVGGVAQAAIGNVVVGTALAVSGVGIGGLTQSPPLAGTAVALVWLGLSNLLSTFWAFFRHYGLVAAQVTLTQPTGHHSYSFAGAFAVTAGLTLVLLLAGLRRVEHADIT